MLLLLLLLACSLLPAQDPSIYFSKSFPKSKPEFYEVKLARDGRVEYREAPDFDLPVKFALKTEETQAIFLLAEKLERFKRNLESGLPVARMGEKTFRWELGDSQTETKFNYSTDPDAQALLEWFDRMSESAQYFIDLERTVKFDRLGVNHALLKLEAAWDKKRLVGVEQYLKLLDRVAKNESYMNMARERAERLAAIFRAGTEAPAQPPAEAKPQQAEGKPQQ
jgi:hypothetical protein